MEFINYFEDELNLSLSLAQHDMDLLKKIIPYCVDVQKTAAEVDKTGVDYIATLSSGARINIDAKTREKGSSKFWKHGEPELVLEIFGSPIFDAAKLVDRLAENVLDFVFGKLFECLIRLNHCHIDGWVGEEIIGHSFKIAESF